MKQEASSWPSWCSTEAVKLQYEWIEGIRFEYDNIKQNPGLRELAKLMFNSFWGKLRQR